MTPSKRLLGASALIFVILAVLLAGTFIIAIWVEFDSALLQKALGTELVLLLLFGLLYSVAKGMCDKPKENP